MEHFGVSLISQKCFHLQRRSIYPRKGIGTAGDTDQVDIKSVPFSTVEHVENKTVNFTYSFSRVFNGENWNGSDSNLAYVTRRFKSFSGIYRSPLYVKANASYKVTTKHVENGTLWLFTYISEVLSSTAKVDISLESSQKGG